MQTIDHSIPAGKEIIACSVDYADGERAPSVICLHGGGPTGRHSTSYLAAALQAEGRSVIRFDFSGQGDSTGKMAASSLAKRLAETKSVLDYFGLDDGISVIGTSMGGHIACALAREISIENLVFFGPAAYTTRAWDVAFGSGFTEIIREENSFLNSDIVDLLRGFSGNALYFIGSDDEIIPEQVVDLYREALSHCSIFEAYTVVDCPHPIHRWALKHPEVQKEIEGKVLSLIESGDSSSSQKLTGRLKPIT
jgi:pimeloyl-ACP methyl ester carboxylesterase